MKLSIIIPTLGRTTEFDSLLNSILSSDFKELEIIVVDQNFSDILSTIISKYNESLIIRHYLVDFRGLSRAKNFGITKAIGEIICFIDDDAEFFSNTIQIALNRMNSMEVDIVCGRCVDRNNQSSVKFFDLNSSWLTFNSFEDKFIESTMFFRHKCFDNFSYDENLGIGTFHGAEEGYDLVYRMLQEGIKIFYDSKILIYHPQVISQHSSDKEVKRVFLYRSGFAYMCNKHNLHKKYYLRLLKVFLYIPYTFLFKRKATRYYMAELLGLISGKVIR